VSPFLAQNSGDPEHSFTEDTMTKAKSPIPAGFRSLTQYLILDHAADFLKFIEGAFGASEKFLMRDDNGIIRHAEAQLGESIIEFAEATGQWKATPAGLHYYVKNSDEVYAQALKAGGTSLYEPANRDYGDRDAGVRDPAGNFWFISTHTAGNGFKPVTLQDLNSYFSVKDSLRFLGFLEKAFRAEAIEKYKGKDGGVMHAKVRIGDTVVELSEGRAPWGPRTVSHHYYVENCDEVFASGLANGCTELQPMADQFYGDRSGSLLDPWGNHWYIASHLEDLTPEEMQQRAAAAGRR
jgi:PhnB protein